jgi:methylenetetrahydrofolate reductase (NADPH)
METSTRLQAVTATEVSAAAAELVTNGSVEMGTHRPEDAHGIAALVPAGTPVYVNHLPRHSLADSLASLIAVREAGLEPVPHVAARRILNRAEVDSFLGHAVNKAGVRKVLLIGGDENAPLGPYPDAGSLLREGILPACGVRELGIASHPEGNPRVPLAQLERAFDEKLAIANAQGLGAYVVTQFSFSPARILEHCTSLARRAPGVPVYVGLAGPTSAGTLLRFAQRCGVSASLRALRNQGMAAVNLVTHTDPGDQLAALARYCVSHPGGNVVGVHVFSFGGAVPAAAWMHETITKLDQR